MYSDNRSRFFNMFYFTLYRFSTPCVQCGKRRAPAKPGHEFGHSLSLIRSTSGNLQDLIIRSLTEKVEYLICEHCETKSSNASQYIHFVKTPEILVLQLNFIDHQHRKVRHSVLIPDTVKLPRYQTRNPNNPDYPDAYQLVATVRHKGRNTNFGHYITTASGPRGLCRIDDEKVREIRELDNETDGDAYILFYVKTSTL